MTKYLAAGCVILALLCVVFFYRGQVYVAKYKGEVEKVAQRDATIKNQADVANKQRTGDKKVIESYQKLLKECQDTIPVCPPTQIICEGGKCNVTIEPCEAPF
jgi:hypothetical protein